MFVQILEGMSMGKLRTGALDYDTVAASNESGIACKDESLTQQHQAKDADINEIMRRFGQTGLVPTNVRVPLNVEFAETLDFHSAMNQVRQAEEAFMALPADVRSKFGNDPGAFVDFATAAVSGDAGKLSELRKLGLAPEAPVKVGEPVKAVVSEDKGPSSVPVQAVTG